MEREKILNEILAVEWEMFHAVPNEGGTADCQQQPNAFRLMRKVAYKPLSAAFLTAWYAALCSAQADGRNLMTEKYAFMDSRAVPAADGADPHIAAILDAECRWRAAVHDEFPHMVQKDDGFFRRYLAGEMHTYTPAALAAYADCVHTALAEGRNMVRERYEFLAEQLGYASLAACEQETMHQQQAPVSGCNAGRA